MLKSSLKNLKISPLESPYFSLFFIAFSTHVKFLTKIANFPEH